MTYNVPSSWYFTNLASQKNVALDLINSSVDVNAIFIEFSVKQQDTFLRV